MAEAPQLGDVAPEEERRRPVRHDPRLAAEERQRVEVVGACDEPTEEARDAYPHHVRNSLEAAERRDLAEHAVAIWLRLPGEVLRQLPRLPQGVLAGRRVRLAWRADVRHRSAVAERP